VFFTLTLVVAAGLLGGILGNRLQQRGIVPSSMRQQTSPDETLPGHQPPNRNHQ
jgi:hypothetical protein